MRQGDELVKFDRIVFNFPCVGLLEEQQALAVQEKETKKMESRLRKAGKGKLPAQEKKSSNSDVLEKGRAEAAAKRALVEKKLVADKELVARFFESAKDHLSGDASQIHLALRRLQVDMMGAKTIQRLAQKAGLVCSEMADFHPGRYQGYGLYVYPYILSFIRRISSIEIVSKIMYATLVYTAYSLPAFPVLNETLSSSSSSVIRPSLTGS